jgi:hypothetical protein
MLGLLFVIWGAGRTMLWESPFPLSLPSSEIFLAERASVPAIPPAPTEILWDDQGEATALLTNRQEYRGADAGSFGVSEPIGQQQPARIRMSSAVAAGHSFLMAAAFKVDWSDDRTDASAGAAGGNQSRVSPVAPPFADQSGAAANDSDRWSLDAFAFYRQGSGSTSISQGRVPVYGASQIAVNLQYRIDPSSRRDPRAYVRAYRAFVPDAENELAIGLSARPYGPVPVRVAAELRATNNRFGTEIRPAAYAVTELPAARLPFDLRMEAYGGAGYVGGSADTAFVDGQVAITREVASFAGPLAGSGYNASDQRIRLSFGGGAWGGAQKDASRLDVGPTIRLDLTLGEVPARLSVDWRERVAGDAAPESGIAATLSTRF